MGFVIGTAIAFWLLDPPWRYIVILLLAGWEVFEIWLFLHLRRLRSITGREAIAGTKGTALTDCRPAGQVRIKGQIWKARCRQGVDAGEEIVVDAVDGLTLEVSPLRST